MEHDHLPKHQHLAAPRHKLRLPCVLKYTSPYTTRHPQVAALYWTTRSRSSLTSSVSSKFKGTEIITEEQSTSRTRADLYSRSTGASTTAPRLPSSPHACNTVSEQGKAMAPSAQAVDVRVCISRSPSAAPPQLVSLKSYIGQSSAPKLGQAGAGVLGAAREQSCYGPHGAEQSFSRPSMTRAGTSLAEPLHVLTSVGVRMIHTDRGQR